MDALNVNALPAPARLLLLDKLRFAKEQLFCAVCRRQITTDACIILPPIISTARRADIICEQPSCMTTWMDDHATNQSLVITAGSPEGNSIRLSQPAAL